MLRNPPASPLTRLSGPRHRLGTWLAILLSILATLPWFLDLTPREGILRYHVDFHVYREGALALLAGDNIYLRDYEVRGATLPFTYPPLGAFLLTPLTLLPMMAGAALWTLLTVILLWWCLVIVLRRLLPRMAAADHLVLATWALPVALLFEPVRETLSFGQINILLMLLVLLDTLGPDTRRTRGVLIGLAAAIKLTPAVFILFFLVRRDWRGAVTTVAAGVFFTLLAFALNPTISWTYWVDTLSDTGRIGELAYAANQSFQGMLFRVLPAEAVDPTWLLLVLLSLVAVIAAMLLLQRTATDATDPAPGLVLLNSLVALVCSPVSWSHHWVWLVPLALVCAVAWWRSRGQDPRCQRLSGGMLLLVLSGVLFSPHWLLPTTGDWAWWAQPWGNTYLIIALCLVLTVLLAPRSGSPLLRGWAGGLFLGALVLSLGSVLLLF